MEKSRILRISKQLWRSPRLSISLKSTSMSSRYSIKTLSWEHVLECYVYKNVSRAGATGIHRCAAEARFDSWLEAFGLGERVSRRKTPITVMALARSFSESNGEIPSYGRLVLTCVASLDGLPVRSKGQKCGKTVKSYVTCLAGYSPLQGVSHYFGLRLPA